jgi:hypothetical protein
MLGWVGYTFSYGLHIVQIKSQEDLSVTEFRKFETGATRDADTTKPDYSGFLSSRVIHRFGQYMHKNRVQRDGTLRPANNWKKGIPLESYLSSLWRHFEDIWLIADGATELSTTPDAEEALCAVIFNAQGMLHEILQGKKFNENPKI